MTNVVELILRARDQASAVVNKVDKQVGGLTATIDKHEASIRRAGLAGAAMTAGLLAAAKGAETQRKTQAQLAAVVDATGQSYARVAPQVEKTIAALQKQTAVSDELQREVLSKLVVQTGSLDKAMAALPAVLDTAAASGRDVNAVAETLGKALAGTSNMAESLGIKFDEAADFSERLEIVMGKVGGTAAATATPSEKLQAALGDMSDAIGTALLPHLERLANWLTELIEDFNSLSEDTQALIAGGASFVALGLAMAPLLTLLPAITTAVGALGTALAFLAANPIVLVVAALTALAFWLTDVTDLFGEGEEAINANIEKTKIITKETLGFAEAEQRVALVARDAVVSVDEVTEAVGEQAESLVGAVEAADQYVVAFASVEQMNAEFLANLEAAEPKVEAAVHAAYVQPFTAATGDVHAQFATIPVVLETELAEAYDVAVAGVDAINGVFGQLHGPPGFTGLSGGSVFTKDQLIAQIAALEELVAKHGSLSGIGAVHNASLENAKQALEDLNNASSVQGPGTFASSFGGGGGPGALSTAVGGKGLTNYGTFNFNGIANPMEVLEVLDPLGAA